jgi:hypothetical protein
MVCSSGAIAAYLVLLAGVTAQDGTGDDERRRTIELLRRPGRCELSLARELGSTLRTEDSKAPGVRQPVVRCPPRKLEELAQRRAIDRLRVERLVGSPRANRRVHVHRAFTVSQADGDPVGSGPRKGLAARRTTRCYRERL